MTEGLLGDLQESELESLTDILGDELADAVSQKIAASLGLPQQPELVETSPQDGVETFLKGCEITDSTKETYRTRMVYFTEYCSEHDISNLNDLTSEFLEKFRIWRRDESYSGGTLAKKTQRDNQQTLRSAVKYWERTNVVKKGVSDDIFVPTLEGNEGVSEVYLEPERVGPILEYFETFEFATKAHIIFLLMCITGGRTSDVLALDVDDCNLKGDDPYLIFRDRDVKGTRLKNGESSEREVSISADSARVIWAYIENVRKDRKDDAGRDPLITTDKGRISESTLRKAVYGATRPCMIGECPHGSKKADCESARVLDKASKCPSTKSPHPVRKGYITAERAAGVPREVLSERCDVSPRVLEKHYDLRSESQRRESRKNLLQMVYDGGISSYGL